MIQAGIRLGPYEIVAPLGAGGMGEVWRARDTRLGRDVAIKVLPQHLAATDDARARLDREARAISGLNHPHICTLYDVGHQDGIDFLVMELVDGETLAARLARGALPAPELLRLAIQIAEALDVAHRQGIVHRDLKPANVMLTRTGAKLMDFGLARAAAPAAGSGSSGVTGDPSDSPTISRSLTAEGALIGTFAYMAPEQLEGQEADARSDLWALGCVLYEMATGRRAFEGRSQASLIGAVMNSEPPSLTAAAPLSPPALDRVVTACLAKERGDRIQTAHDVKLQLQWIAEGGSLAGVPQPVATRRRHRERLAWSLLAAVGAVALWSSVSALTRTEPTPKEIRFALSPQKGMRTMTWPRVSPDGNALAFQATDSLGNVQIWVRPLDALTAHPLLGTDGAGRPFWSPDSRYLAYFIGNQLKKIAVAGGPPQLVCETRSAADGTWGSRDVILFDGSVGDSIRQVPASGGVASGATTRDVASGENQHAWPCFLPDGRHFLFMAYGSGGDQGGVLRVGDLDSHETANLGPVASRVEFAPPDLVLYTAESTLMARHLDLGSWTWKSEPFPVAEHVLTRGNGQANFSVSTDGVLAIMTGGATERSELVWVDRAGQRLGRVGDPGGYRDLALSPDGGRLAYGFVDPKNDSQDIWVRDLTRGVTSRLTFGNENDIFPVWSPDGNWIAYSTNVDGPYSIWKKRADGSGDADSLFADNFHAGAMSWSPDGASLVMVTLQNGNPDLWVLPLEGGEPHAIVESGFIETDGTLSPDGRWFAYMSTESGSPQVYVRAYPGPGGKWQVSTSGGSSPQWRVDGQELFFLGEAGTVMMAAAVDASQTFRVGTPVKLFDATLTISEISRNRYVVTADGQKFLLNLPLETNQVGVFQVSLNWAQEFAKK